MSQQNLEVVEREAFGLMGRLHVLLRRETGRVTDIKYMSTNPEYCAHVLELAALVTNADLHLICERLDEIYFGERGLFDTPQLRQRRVVVPKPIKPILVAEPAFVAVDPDDQHYVGRLR